MLSTKQGGAKAAERAGGGAIYQLLATDPGETARGMVRRATPAADAGAVYALSLEEQQLLVEIPYYQEQVQQLQYLVLQRTQRLQEVQQQLQILQQPHALQAEAPAGKKRKVE